MPNAQDFDRVVEYVLGCTPHPKSHLKWQYHIGGKLIGWTMRSHSLRRGAQLSDRTIGDMAKEMRCSSAIWKRLLSGQATLRDYLDDLLDRGIIDQGQHQAGLFEYDQKRRR